MHMELHSYGTAKMNVKVHEMKIRFEKVRNYDGNWTEWGNLIEAPIEKGEAKAADA